MKKIVVLFTFLIISVINLQSLDMKLPQANDNSLFKSIAGTWISEPYEIMGVKWVDEAEFKWILNNQFLEMEVITKGDNGFNFKSFGILSVDEDGNYKSWGFDEWGPISVSYSEGKVEGNKIKSTGGSQFMKSSTEIVIDGNVTTEVFNYTVKDEQGKETPATLNLIYHKK